MSAPWTEEQQAAILAVLDRLVEDGERARVVRDMLEGKRRKLSPGALPWSHATTVDPLPWDGLTAEMQDTYRRTSAAYAEQVERARQAQANNEAKETKP